MHVTPTDTSETETIAQSIIVVRGQRVLLDAELAALYGVPTKALNQAVKRNSARFPPDFLLRLTAAEFAALNRSHSGSQRHRDPRHTPYAFTEHGALMAATVLNSPRAVEMSVFQASWHRVHCRPGTLTFHPPISHTDVGAGEGALTRAARDLSHCSGRGGGHARRLRSISRRISGVRINCIASPILPPGATMLLGRDIDEPSSIDSR